MGQYLCSRDRSGHYFLTLWGSKRRAEGAPVPIQPSGYVGGGGEGGVGWDLVFLVWCRRDWMRW